MTAFSAGSPRKSTPEMGEEEAVDMADDEAISLPLVDPVRGGRDSFDVIRVNVK